MRTKDHRHLLDELPKMVDAGLITSEQSSRIRDHYSPSLANRPNTSLIAFSILGSVLLAAGIILILAHNWSEIPRALRTALAFLPLIASQAIGFWVLRSRMHSVAWTEGISVFGFISVGAAIALISQIYHIKGGLESYLLTWMLLAIPLVYVYRSTASTCLYGVGITAWAIAERVAGGTAAGFWILALLAAPSLYLAARRLTRGPVKGVVSLIAAISLVCGGTLATGSITVGMWVLVMIGLLLCLFSVGVVADPDGPWRSPFSRLGTLGLAVTYAVLSYRGVWHAMSYAVNTEAGLSTHIGTGVVAIACVSTVALAIVRRPAIAGPMALGLPITLVCFGLGHGGVAAGLVFSVYVFALGVHYLVQGMRAVSGRMLNFGFLLVAGAVILRFFDSDWSFTVRGIAFVALGGGFLTANVFLARRKKARS